MQNPDLALKEDIALKILFKGLRDGDFTGLRLSQFIVNTLTYANQARKTVNGLDQAEPIAQRAYFWYNRLTIY